MKFCVTFLLLLACSAGVSAQSFVDVAADLGISHIYGECGKASGLAFTDFNGDGLDDVLLPTCSGLPIRIFKNTGGGFVEYFHPVLMESEYESKCILVVDYDNDGDRDILVVNAGAPNQLFRCDGTNDYTDVSGFAGLWNEDYDSYTASFGDLDKDGDLDLYIGNRAPTGIWQPNPLYRNNGDGTFTEIGDAGGVYDGNGAALAVGFVDIDNDTWPDIYVANDKQTGNKCYRNLGDGTFADISASSESDYEMDAMSVSVVDTNQDGYLDIYVTNTPTGNVFFINDQDLTFTEVAEDYGLTVNKGTWGAIFVDLDADGDQDLYVPAMGPSQDLSNDHYSVEDNVWTLDEAAFPLDDRPGMGAATGDLNQDGKPDLIVTNMGAEAYFFENTAPIGHWIEVLPIGTTSGTEAVGSWIEVYCGTDVFRRYTTLGSNFASQDSRSVHIGIGDHTVIDHLEVHFPLGHVQTVDAPSIDQEIEVVEGPATTIVEASAPWLLSPVGPARWQLGGTDAATWQVLDLSGRTALVGSKNAEPCTVDLTTQPAGAYFLHVQSGGTQAHVYRLVR